MITEPPQRPEVMMVVSEEIHCTYLHRPQSMSRHRVLWGCYSLGIPCYHKSSNQPHTHLHHHMLK